jgi:hypothetical protein
MKTIAVEPDSELDRLLESLHEETVLLVRSGVRYRLAREDEDPFANYDPKRVRAALDRAFGTLKGVNVPELLEELRAQREQDSVGRPAE